MFDNKYLKKISNTQFYNKLLFHKNSTQYQFTDRHCSIRGEIFRRVANSRKGKLLGKGESLFWFAGIIVYINNKKCVKA